jgi:cell division protein FtsB
MIFFPELEDEMSPKEARSWERKEWNRMQTKIFELQKRNAELENKNKKLKKENSKLRNSAKT